MSVPVANQKVFFQSVLVTNYYRSRGGGIKQGPFDTLRTFGTFLQDGLVTSDNNLRIVAKLADSSLP